MNVNELSLLLRDAASPAGVFGDDTDVSYRSFALICHPDRFPADSPECAIAAQTFKLLEEWRGIAEKPPVEFTLNGKTYRLGRKLATGDTSDVFTAAADGEPFVLKVARTTNVVPMLKAECGRLRELRTIAGDRSYSSYLPILVDGGEPTSTNGSATWLTVCRHRPGLWRLDEVLAHHKEGVDGRTMAWMFKRLLTVLGFAHNSGVVNTAVVPEHILIHAENHGLILLGWLHGMAPGCSIGPVPAKYVSWYPDDVRQKKVARPDLDIWLAAKVMSYIVGGDLTKGTFPDSVPKSIKNFLLGCMLETSRMRPHDAWQLCKEFDGVLRREYGPPRYQPLLM